MCDKQQNEVINLIVNQRKNVFLTGPAGTGKSTILKRVVDLLDGLGLHTSLSASTGIASYNINGVTFHRFVGCRLAKGSPEKLAEQIRQRPELLMKWKSVDVLIIDEISMIGADLFDRVEKTARLVRERDEPFGGIQIIAVGDFLQLPPVKARHCFHAKTWSTVIDQVVHLDRVFRQKHKRFTEILARLRVGQTKSEDDKWIQNLKRPLNLPEGVEPTYTVCRKTDADRINNAFLRKRKGPSRSFIAFDTIRGDIDVSDINRECIMKQRLQLRIGAKVMLTFNYSDEIVNGSTGTVVGFTDGLPVVQFYSGKKLTVAHVTWDMTIKSSQERTGISGPTQEIDVKSVRSVASRRQLPLILAWAITIHKSQGQTLDWQIAIVSNVFEAGQMYTALSRARDPTRLQVLGYDPNKNRICKETLMYYGIT